MWRIVERDNPFSIQPSILMKDQEEEELKQSHLGMYMATTRGHLITIKLFPCGREKGQGHRRGERLPLLPPLWRHPFHQV